MSETRVASSSICKYLRSQLRTDLVWVQHLKRDFQKDLSGGKGDAVKVISYDADENGTSLHDCYKCYSQM